MCSMAVRNTDWNKGCGAECVLADLDGISDWFWDASNTGVLSVLDGWSETKPSLLLLVMWGWLAE